MAALLLYDEALRRSAHDRLVYDEALFVHSKLLPTGAEADDDACFPPSVDAGGRGPGEARPC